MQALWNYRGFILSSVKREFQLKYRNSMLGAAWTVLNPLAMITVYTVIFSQVMRARLPGVETSFSYGIYLCSGVLTWGLFAEIAGRTMNVFLDNANLLKKLNFPRLCLPITVVASSFLNFSIIFGIFIIFLAITGNTPGIVLLGIIPITIVLIGFAVGLGIVLGVLNVFFRDVGQLFSVVIQFWFWLTPIVYPLTILPEKLRPLMQLNPLANLIGAYQSILVWHEWPRWLSLTPVCLLAAVLCFWGYRLFRAHVGEMVDEL